MIRTIFTLVVFPALFFASTPVEAVDTVCKPNSPSSIITTCNGGTWPQSGPIEIPAKTETLRIQSVTLQEKDLLPVPAIVKLQALELKAIIAKDDQDQVTRFPFKHFTSLLTFPNDAATQGVSTIYLIDLDLRDVRANDFGGAIFDNLAGLSIHSCRLISMDLKSFEPVRPDTPPESIVFKHFILEDAQDFKNLPWEVLRPFSETIQNVELIENADLLSVDYAPATDSPALTFKNLYKVSFHTNKLLSTVPRPVVETFLDAKVPDGALARKFAGVFKNNANKCGTCDLIPLVFWYRQPVTGTDTRSLEATCIKADDSVETLPNTAAAWAALPVPAECLPVTPEPTPGPTDPSAATVRSTTPSSTGLSVNRSAGRIWLFFSVIFFVVSSL